MQFSTHADIQAPIAWVFQQLSDFPAFERQAMRRGADLRRVDDLPRPGLGSAWDVQFQFRGRDRQLRAEVTGFEVPSSLVITAVSPNMGGVSTVELVSLARTTTRMTVSLEVTAKSLSARLLLQSLKLAKGNLTRKFETGVSGYALNLQDRYQRRAGG